jgi:PDZ domain-containing protein
MSKTFRSGMLAGLSALTALCLLGALSGPWTVEAQAPPPPKTVKKTPTPTPRAPKGGGGGGGGGTTAPAARATLLIDADMACTVSIDGEGSYKVPAQKPTKIEVAPGEHLLKAVSDDGKRMLDDVVVKAGAGGNTVVKLDLTNAVQQNDPELDRQAAKVFVAITDLRVLSEFIGSLWKRSFFFHDRGITEAFHTAKVALVNETTTLAKHSTRSPQRQRVLEELARLSTEGQKYVDLITQAITAAQSANSSIGEPTNSFGQAQAIATSLKLSAEALATVKGSADFVAGMPPDARSRIGLPNDKSDVAVGIDYAHSVPNVVAVIDKGTPADGWGLKPGDRIVSVDGRDADVWALKQALRGAAGRKLSVVIEREGKQQRKEIRG